MTDTPSGDARRIEDTVSTSALPLFPGPDRFGPVTYTIRVLSTGTDGAGEACRTVLFQRTWAGESIEISAETDAPNLLATLPDLLEAALDFQRARLPGGPSRASPLLAAESRLVRWLTDGDRPPGEGASPLRPRGGRGAG